MLAGLADWPLYLVVRAAFAVVRVLGPDRASALGGAVMRAIGPLMPVHRLAADNLRRALPGLDAAARAAILRGAWDNLGRMSCEYVHMDVIGAYDVNHPETSRIEVPPDIIDAFMAMRDDGQAALVFTAHLANWELPPILARQYDMPAAALYRMPNNKLVGAYIRRLRAGLMGRLVQAGASAPLELSAAVRRGEHVGMLVDQRFGRGPKVIFFDRPATANPVFAKLARHHDVPVYGVRAIRLRGARFRMSIEGPIALPRDAAGLIDELGATQAITTIVERWVREHPEQWLWMHRRWRV